MAWPLTAYQTLVQKDIEKESCFPGSYFFPKSPKIIVDMTVPWLAAQKFGQQLQQP
jgi:hypothetical protein